MNKGFLGGRANQVLAATGLTIAALHGGIEVAEANHGWTVEGDYFPLMGAEVVSREESISVEEHPEDSYLMPAQETAPEAIQTCIVPATEITTIDITTGFKDWTIPYGIPFLLGGTSLALLADNRQRYGKFLPEHTRRKMVEIGAIGGAIVIGGVLVTGGLMYALERSSEPRYTAQDVYSAPTQGVPTTVEDSDTVTTSQSPAYTPSFDYSLPSEEPDNCEDVEMKVVKVTSEKTVTYRDGRRE